MANLYQIGSGVAAAAGGGAGTPPGNPSGLSAEVIEYESQEIVDRRTKRTTGVRKLAHVGLKGTKPSPLGTYAGVHVYVETPDGGTSRPVAGSSTAGSDVAGSNLTLSNQGKFPDGIDPAYLATFLLPADGASYSARIYAVGYSAHAENVLVPASEPSPSPSCLITIGQPSGEVLGREYAELVTGLTATADTAQIGGVLHSRVFVTFTPPDDAHWNGCYIYVIYKDDTGTERTNIGLVVSGAGLYPSNWFPAPPSQIAKVRALSFSDPAGTSDPSDDGVNTYVSGLTPETTVSIGTDSGTVNLSYSFGFNAAEFSIDPTTGEFKVENVDFTKAVNFDTSMFDLSSGDFAIAAAGITTTLVADDAITTPKLISGAVTTLKLTTSEISLGGGGSKPIRFRVYDSSGNPIGWIGDDTANTGLVGAWFKRLLVGGTAPGNAPFFADASGNVVANGIYINSAGSPLGWIGANGSDTGAWFKKLAIGGTSFATGKVQADASGNVTINGASFTLNLNGATVAITNSADPILTTPSGLKMTDNASGGYCSVVPMSFFFSDQATAGGRRGNLGIDGFGNPILNLSIGFSGNNATIQWIGGNPCLNFNGQSVVKLRKTGWAVATGTATRTTFDTSTVTLVGLAERVKAIIDDIHSSTGHGLLGP